MTRHRLGGAGEALLEEGLVLTIDANLYLDRGRIGQEDVAYITKNGAEFISERQDAIWICNGKN